MCDVIRCPRAFSATDDCLRAAAGRLETWGLAIECCAIGAGTAPAIRQLVAVDPGAGATAATAAFVVPFRPIIRTGAGWIGACEHPPRRMAMPSAVDRSTSDQTP